MLGHIANLWTYPFKSLRAMEHAAVEVQADGIMGDREAALYVTTYGHPRAGKAYRGKEDNRLHLLFSGEAALRAARERGVELEVRAGERFFDAAAVSIVFDTWIAEGSRLAGAPLQPLRFRPNIFARAAKGFSEPEAALVGRRLRIGPCILEVSATIKRCVTPTYDLESGSSNPHISRVIAQERDNVMGVYCSVREPGPLAIGDPIALTGS